MEVGWLAHILHDDVGCVDSDGRNADACLTCAVGGPQARQRKRRRRATEAKSGRPCWAHDERRRDKRGRRSGRWRQGRWWLDGLAIRPGAVIAYEHTDSTRAPGQRRRSFAVLVMLTTAAMGMISRRGLQRRYEMMQDGNRHEDRRDDYHPTCTQPAQNPWRVSASPQAGML